MFFTIVTALCSYELLLFIYLFTIFPLSCISELQTDIIFIWPEEHPLVFPLVHVYA